MLNLAHNLNRQRRHNEAEQMDQKVLSLLDNCEVYAKRIVERIECMKVVSLSQCNRGKTLEAEQTKGDTNNCGPVGITTFLGP